jgi:hypothetical protein
MSYLSHRKRWIKRFMPLLFVLLFIASCAPGKGNDSCGKVLVTTQNSSAIVASGQLINSDDVSYLLRLDGSQTLVATSVSSTEATFPKPAPGAYSAKWFVSGCPGTDGQVEIRGPSIIAVE